MSENEPAENEPAEIEYIAPCLPYTDAIAFHCDYGMERFAVSLREHGFNVTTPDEEEESQNVNQLIKALSSQRTFITTDDDYQFSTGHIGIIVIPDDPRCTNALISVCARLLVRFPKAKDTRR